jgi:hypothetical protein
MVQNVLGKYRRFARNDVQVIALSIQFGEQIGDSRVNGVLEHTGGNETFAIQLNGVLDELCVLAIEQYSKALVQRRTDVTYEL